MSLRAKLGLLPISRITRFVAVIAIAIAAGHLAQTLAAKQPPAVVRAEAVPIHIVQLSSGGPTEALMASPERHVLALEKPSTEPQCTAGLTLRADGAGMIDVKLAAPCRESERVVLRYAELAITARTGSDGTMNVRLPALALEGTVAVMFGDGYRTEQTVLTPEAASLRRVGVQWQGVDAFELHGLENGADIGAAGDISSRNTGNDTGGFLMTLGDSSVENPLLAEIYTYPKAGTDEPLVVLDAAVLPETCDHDLLGEVLTSQAGRVQTTDLTLSMPDCSAVGDFLVLKNLVSDLKIAAN